MLNFFIGFFVICKSCEVGEYPDPSSSTDQNCLKCSQACFSCTGPGADECLLCSQSFTKIHQICMKNCPLGYINSSSQCIDETSNGIAFDLDFTQLKNNLSNKAKITEETLTTSGNSSSFYPDFDYFDPYPIKNRGFYFDGSAYIKNQGLTFAPVFTIALWVRSKDGSGTLYAKQSSSELYLMLSLTQYKVKFSFNLLNLESFTSSNGLTEDKWDFVMIKVTLSSAKSKVSIRINKKNEVSSVFSTFYEDEFLDYSSTIGAYLEDDSYSKFFKGLLWRFVVGNKELEYSQFLQTKDCSGCSVCPTNNNDECISGCDFNQYIQNNQCKTCSNSCQTFGCVRNDTDCNLCQDFKCKKCLDFSSGCQECISNAVLNNGTCECNNNTWWDKSKLTCRSCDENCLNCDGKGSLGCSSCTKNYYLLNGICVPFCPLGFTVNDKTCELANGTRLANFLFDQIEGIVYDSVNLVPAITGKSSRFYPDYEETDPYAVYGRGYYFNGKSVVNFAPYLEYTQPFISFPPMFYNAFWISCTNSQGIVMSSVDAQYDELVVVEVYEQHPKISLSLSQLSSKLKHLITHTCDLTLTLHSWSYLAFKIELTSQEETYITCYLNSLSTAASLLSIGYFSDPNQSNSMVLGSQKLSDSIYSTNNFIGFIYQLIIDTNINSPLSDYSTDCSEPCQICPLTTCLSDCHIDQYPTPDLSSCLSCNSNCSLHSCRSPDSNCNICEDSTCKICSGYSENDCQSYYCPDGTYKKLGMNNCKSCHADCLTCDDYGPGSCTSCNVTYLLNSACHSFCPTGYEYSNFTCVLSSEKVIQLNFDQISNVYDENSKFFAVSGNGTGVYPMFGDSQPWPVIGRGYYFTGKSYVQLPPNSVNETEILIGNQFTLAFWINGLGDGCLLSKQDSDGNLALGVRVLNQSVVVSLMLDSLQVVNSSLRIDAGWNYLTVLVKFTADGRTECRFKVNLENEKKTVGLGRFNDVTENSVFLIAAKKNYPKFEEFWNGMMFRFSLYSVAVSPKEATSDCNSQCDVCPLSLGHCINLCEHNTWWNGNECIECNECDYESCRRSDSSCNLCEDVQCSLCDNFLTNSCTECISNADMNNGDCSCSVQYTWDPIQESCTYCDPSTKAISQGVCLQYCPSGYSKLSGKCDGEPSSIFHIKLDKIIKGSITDFTSNIKLTTGLSSEFYPFYELADPIATKNQGYYFNGLSNYMKFDENSELMLSPSFSIAVWINPYGPGTIFSKQYEGSKSFQIEINSNATLKISVKLAYSEVISETISDSFVEFFEWNYIGVTLILQEDLSTLISVTVNKEAKTGFLGSAPFIDYFYMSTCTIGANYNASQVLENHFQGYIQSIQIWNYPASVLNEISTDCEGSCEICPKSGICLNNCKYYQYFSNNCTNCSQSCIDGCVRQEDCNLCFDRLCESCFDYSSTGCTKCVNGAVMKNGECQCENGDVQVKDNGNYYCKVNCMEYCKGCYSMQNGDCYDCNEGFYLEGSGLCLPQCQTGYKPQGVNCVPVRSNEKILYFVFNSTVNQPIDSIFGIPAYMGSSDQYIPNFDSNDPVPLYHRGLYFNGNSNYLTIGNNSNDLQYIVFGNTHSIQLWMRPMQQSENSCLYSKESSSQYMYLYLDSTLKPHAQYKVSSIIQTFSSSFTATGKPLDSNTWQQLLIVFQRTGRLNTITIYVNGIANPTSFAFKSFFEEPKDLVFTLGYSKLANSSYLGFIYEISVYNFAVSEVDPDSYSCNCEKCTASGDCLSDCEPKEYISGETCENCQESCEFGCGSLLSCSLNPDYLCETFTGFAKENCSACVELAQMTDQGCSCVPYSTYNDLKCECFDQFEVFENNCFPCFYFIDSNETAAYFDEDYLHVIVEFDYNMNEGISSNCEELLDSQTLKAFGIGSSCVWMENMRKLEISLGINAQIVQGTVLGFKENTLYTRIVKCGSDRGPVYTEVVFKYDPPVVIPLGIINSPSILFTPCGDLLMTGRNSLGGYGRVLAYNWVLDSDPDLLVFSYNYTNETLFFSNFSLSSSNVTIYLTVKNWLGFSNTVSQSLEITEKQGINLIYDYNINWKLTSQQSKSILITPSTECYTSNSLSYNWTILSKIGEYSYVNESLLWSSQQIISKFYIPKNSLGPGLYTFQVTVDDPEQNLTGSALLHIFVDFNELVIKFSPHYYTTSKNTDLILDGSVAYDPDDIKEDLKYNWRCNNGTDCSSILSSTTEQNPKISKENLTDFSEYSFELIITKGKRTAFDVFTVFINSNSSVSLKFPRHRRYLNNQEDYTLKPVLDNECNCSFAWTVSSKAEYNLTTDLYSKDLGFAKNSMREGELYSVYLDVTDEYAEHSVFIDYFLVDFLPVDGEFFVEPSQGIAEQTVFEFSAPGWFDIKSANFPLYFQFGYYIEGTEVFINFKNESSRVFTLLPNNDQIEAFVRIFDLFGSFIEKSAFVRVSGQNAELGQVVENFEKNLEKLWFDADLIPGELFRIKYYSEKANLNASETLKNFKISLKGLQKMRDLRRDSDANTLDVFLSTVYQVSCYSVKERYKEVLLDFVEFSMNLVNSYGISVSYEKAQYISNIIENVYNLSSSLVTSHPNRLNKINKLLKTLALASSITLGQSQELSFSSSNLLLSFQVHKGSTLSSLQIPPSNSQPSISLPSSDSLNYPSSLSILSIFISYTPESSPEHGKESSSAVEFSLIKLSKNGPEKLKIDLKSGHIKIRIPVWNPENIVECVYWDQNKWSNKGCELDYYSGNTSYCKCSHTSLFSSGSRLLEYLGYNQNPIIVIICCLVACFWVLLNCFFIIKDQKEAENKEFIDEVLSNLENAEAKHCGKVLETELAEKLGNDKQVESSSQKRDSQFVPTARIGVVGAYFQDNLEPAEEIRESEGFDHSKDKKGLPVFSMYEELKESEHSGDLQLPQSKKNKLGTSAFQESENILPDSEMEKIRGLKNPPKISTEFYYDKASDLSPEIPDPARHLSLKVPPNLGVIITPESQTEVLEKQFIKRGSEFIPRIADIQDLQTESEKEKSSEKKGPKFAKVLSKDLDSPNPESENSGIPSQLSEIKPADDNVAQVDPNDLKISESEEPDIMHDKHSDNTDLFTAPNSPRKKILMFTANEPVKRKYPACIGNYYLSGLCFYHENYTRAVRCSQGVCSFFIQTLLIGLVIKGTGEDYSESKGKSFSKIFSNIEFQDISVAFVMTIVANFTVFIGICACFRNRMPAAFATEQDRLNIMSKNSKKEIFRFVIIAGVVLFLTLGIGILELEMKEQQSIFWFCCELIAVIFDFCCVQTIKVLIFGLISQGLILPSY